MRCSSMETAPAKGPDDLPRASARDWFPVQLTGIRFQFVPALVPLHMKYHKVVYLDQSSSSVEP